MNGIPSDFLDNLSMGDLVTVVRVSDSKRWLGMVEYHSHSYEDGSYKVSVLQHSPYNDYGTCMIEYDGETGVEIRPDRGDTKIIPFKLDDYQECIEDVYKSLLHIFVEAIDWSEDGPDEECFESMVRETRRLLRGQCAY